MTTIKKTISFVKEQLKNAEGGHDWHHIERVWNSSKQIASKYPKANIEVIELAALLHDIADSKFHNGDETIGPKTAKSFLKSINVKQANTIHVLKIIENISYKGGNKAQNFKSIELDIVQDADRLDAIGAIGIARAFSYGGFKNREIFNPETPPNLNMTPEEYKLSSAPSINHFYEKLLLLSKKMNTNEGLKLANERHEFTILFLKQFYKEWYSTHTELLPKDFLI